MKLKNLWICQVQDRQIVPVFGDLEIENGTIKKVVPADFKTRMSSYRMQYESDYRGRVCTLPGVNFHEHIYSRLAKGQPFSGPTETFGEVLENIWWKLDMALDKEMVRASARLTAQESIRQGVTYIIDHHASPRNTRGSLDWISNVLRDAGLRGVLCFETSDRNGPDLREDALWENEFFLRDCVQDEDFKAMLGLHASFTVDDGTLEKSRKIVEKYKTGIHIHLCEGKTDRVESVRKYGAAPVERLAKFNLLNERSILAHGIDLTPEEYRTIEARGSAIVYNPDSNLNNSVGLPLYADVPKSIPLLAGTDGMHANPQRSLKQLFLLHRHQGNPSAESFAWIAKIYFDQLEFIQKYFADFTTLQTGDRADLVIWDYIPPTPFGTDNFWGHYIFGLLESQAHSVMQKGQWLLLDKQPGPEFGSQNPYIIHEQGKRLTGKL